MTPGTFTSAAYPNGAIKERIYYNEKAEVDGLWEQYYPNGRLRTSVNYKRGVLHGPACYYRLDGRLLLTTVYQDGVALYETDGMGNTSHNPEPPVPTGLLAKFAETKTDTETDYKI